MLCLNCKSEIADFAKFCPKCGCASPKPTTSTSGPTKPCPKCGTENLIGAKFCKADGYRFDHAEEPLTAPLPEPPNTVACPACGTANPIGAKFCKKDGERLVGSASSVVAHTEVPRISVVPQALSATQIPIASELPAAASPAQSQPAESVQRPKSIPRPPGRARKWAIAIVMLVVLVSGGVGGYLYFIGAFTSPMELKGTIGSALSAKEMNGIAVDVGDDRVATLTGFADDAAMRIAAVQLVRAVKGVKDVVAKLDVLPSINDTESRLSQTLKNQQLTDIQVRVDEKRNATLTGKVSDAALIEVAKKVAAATLGVKGVTSQVQVMDTPAVTYSDEPQSRTTPQPSPRPPSPPKAKRPAVGSVTPDSVPAAAAAPAPASAPAPERKRTTCEGTGGFNRLTCNIEGPEVYFKCAPDGRNWNNAIPGCNRGTTQN